MVTQKRGLVNGVVPVLQPVAVRAIYPGGTAQGVVGVDVAAAVGEVPVTPQLPGGVVDPLALLDAAIRLAGQPIHGVVAVVHREAVAVLRGGQIAVIVLVGISDQGPAPGGGLQGVAEGVVGEGIRGGGSCDPREVAPAAIGVAHGGRGAAGGAVVRGHLLQPVVIGVVGVFGHAAVGRLHRAQGTGCGIIRILGRIAPVVHRAGDVVAVAFTRANCLLVYAGLIGQSEIFAANGLILERNAMAIQMANQIPVRIRPEIIIDPKSVSYLNFLTKIGIITIE